MCVLLLLHRVVPGHPTVVGANRDESLDRIGEPPARSGAVVAPRDPRAGGTWIGVRDGGLFAGIANRSWLSPDPALRSRGLLCREALEEEDAPAVRALLERETRARGYNPFHLLYSDGRRAFVSRHGPDLATEELPPGVHVLTNRHEFGGAGLTEVEEALRRSPSLDAAVAILRRLLPGHGPRLPGGHPLCVHAEGRGTLSSTLLAVDDVLRPCLLLHAQGPPCRTEYADHGMLLPGGFTSRRLAGGRTPLSPAPARASGRGRSSPAAGPSPRGPRR